MPVYEPDINDVTRIAQVHVRSWQAAYRGLIPAEILDNLRTEPRERWWRQQIATPGTEVVRVVRNSAGQVTGFTSFGPHRDPDLGNDTGELYTIYLLAEYWGQGFGRELLQAALTQLKEMGYRRVSLWVLHTNQRGMAFYQRAGFEPDGAEKTLEIAGTELLEVRLQRPLGE